MALRATLPASDKSMSGWIDSRLDELNKKDQAKALHGASQYLLQAPKTVLDNFSKMAADVKDLIKEDMPTVFLIDEVDKAATETTATLLELLQFRSINGRKLNIRSAILTGNLPDEHAHTNQISHAISKRCQSYRLGLDFNIWREWAYKNGINDHIIQFLSNKPELLHQKATDGDNTAYALPSPRTWTDGAKALDLFERDPVFQSMSEEKALEFKMAILAGSVGESAAANFRSWFQTYRRFDPLIQDLVISGKHPDISSASAQDILVMAISACSRVYAELKPNNKRLFPVTRNVYSWIGTLTPEAQMGAVRISFGQDWNNCQKFGLPKCEEFAKVFRELNDKFKAWDCRIS
jgi:hypothetical protein